MRHLDICKLSLPSYLLFPGKVYLGELHVQLFLMTGSSGSEILRTHDAHVSPTYFSLLYIVRFPFFSCNTLTDHIIPRTDILGS